MDDDDEGNEGRKIKDVIIRGKEGIREMSVIGE